MLCRGTKIKPSKDETGNLEILKILYAKLERIEKLEDGESKKQILAAIVKHFDTFFESKGNDEDMCRLLLKDDVVRGTINDRHRDNIPGQGSNDHRGEREIDGDSLLLRAMSIPSDGSLKMQVLDEIKNKLIKYYPKMITFPKQNVKCKGITPIHVAILKEDITFLQSMADSLDTHLDGDREKFLWKEICADGPLFQNTAMMAGTLLGVATLMFNREIFEFVLKHFSSGLHETNGIGDNIVHSLIKYARAQPDYKKDALSMLEYIRKCKTKKEIFKLLKMKNKEKLTPLQVSAKKEQYEFFEVIMKHEVTHIYCRYFTFIFSFLCMLNKSLFLA